jgi:hypothetical protein
MGLATSISVGQAFLYPSVLAAGAVEAASVVAEPVEVFALPGGWMLTTSTDLIFILEAFDKEENHGV